MNLCRLVEKNGRDDWCIDCEMHHPGHYRDYSQDTGPKGQKFRSYWRGMKHQDKPLPGIIQRGANYIATLREHLAGGSRMVPLYVRQKRWEHCEPCEHRNRERNACAACGCPLNEDNMLGDKLGWAVSQCKLGKWGKWDLPIKGDWIKQPDVWNMFRDMISDELKRLDYYGTIDGSGKGIVIVGGGKYFASAFCNVRLIRYLQCNLPIELWYLGRKDEMPEKWRKIIEPYNVRCIDADEVRKKSPMRILNGWELKFFAVANSGFRKVLFLDADCFPMKDPSFVFNDPRFLGSGAVFQRDCEPYEFIPDVYDMIGVKRKPVWDLETGAFLIDKERWRLPLGITVFLNSYSDLIYEVVYGDKTTPALASLITGVPYAIPRHLPGGGDWGLMQRWFDGSDMWQHRIHLKPSLKFDDFVSPQHKSPKQRREMSLSLPWGNEIESFLAELRRLT